MTSFTLRSSLAAIPLAAVLASCNSSGETLQNAAATTNTAAHTAVLDPQSTAPATTHGATVADGVVISAPVSSADFGSAQHIVAFGDGFVRLQGGGGALTVATSDDGQTWQQIESDLDVLGIQTADSDGSRIVITAFGVDDPQATPWLSVDGGRSWEALPWPEPEAPPGSDYAATTLSVDGTAITAERIVVVGAELTMVDWRAYSVDVLHEDHGDPTDQIFGGESMTVTFADGFELTVDPAALGFSPGMPDMSPVVLVHDGTAWSRADTGGPLQGGSFGFEVAAGPAGFVLIARSASSANGNGMAAFVSTDGETWTSHPLPSELALDGGALIGGPLGYVAVTSTALFHSGDGVDWTKVHEFEDLDDATIMSPPAVNPSAGPAGFVVPITDNLGMNPTLQVFTSRDGTVWTAQPRLDGAIGVATAVSRSLIVVVPFIPGDPADSMPPLPDDDDALAAMLASAYDHERTWISEQEAQCISVGLIAALGTDRIRELRILQYPFSLIGYGLAGMIERDDARALVETYRRCAPDWEALMTTTVTQGTEYISESSARCVSAALDDDVAQEIFILELDRAYDDNPGPTGPDLSHLGPLIAAMTDCLTDQEQNAIDFD